MTMTSLRERNRSRAKRDIGAAALTLFEEQGYAATTVEQIARRAGLSPATFFRYFGSKEEVLFVNEQDAVDGLVAAVAARRDQAQTLQALSAPVVAFAHDYLNDAEAETQRVTRLVMTTRELEARSMHMRLRWEHALAKQLASEQGKEVEAADVLLANLAISCLAAALWQWQSATDAVDVADATRRLFQLAATV
ncbi:TetR family transcriptional regulator [Mycobacterium colombiense]